MHSPICQRLMDVLSADGMNETHLDTLVAHPAYLQMGLKLALTQIALHEASPVNLEPIEMSDGGLLFRQHIEPLPFAMRDWQVYLRQRNSKAAENMRCTLDPARAELFGDLTFHERLAPEVSSIYLLETNQARISPKQAAEMFSEIAPESAARTKPMLVFELLRYFWDEITNLNAAYVVINAAIKDVGFPVIFNSLTQGKRVTFVRGIPQQHEQYTGYYACCG